MKKRVKKMLIDHAIRIAAEVFNDEYVWFVGSCLTIDEEEDAKKEVRTAFKVLRAFGLSHKEVKLHVRRQNNKPEEPLRFVDRVFVPVETEDLLF